MAEEGEEGGSCGELDLGRLRGGLAGCGWWVGRGGVVVARGEPGGQFLLECHGGCFVCLLVA